MSRLRASKTLRAVSLMLCLWLLPRPLRSDDSLRCFYSPLLRTGLQDKYGLVVTQCPPGEVCFQGIGRFGNYSALTHWGCMRESSCDRVRTLRLKGTGYVMSYTCCARSHCNAAPPALPARCLVPVLSTVLLGWGAARL